MGLDGESNAEPLGDWCRRLERLCGRLDLSPSSFWFFGQGAAVDSHNRRLPVIGELEEPLQFGTRVFIRQTNRAADGRNR